MAQDELSGNGPKILGYAEAQLKKHWNDAKKVIARDLGNIWTAEVKEDFKELKKDASRLAFIFARVHSLHRTNKERYIEESRILNDILYYLNRVEAKEEWVRSLDSDLTKVIAELDFLQGRRKFLKSASKATVFTLMPSILKAFIREPGSEAVAASKTSPPRESTPMIIGALSPLNKRRALRKSTRYIILHTTEGQTQGSLAKLQRYGEAHFMLDENGRIYKIMDILKVANHAGRSMWNGLSDLNQHSIGIEIVGFYYKNLNYRQIASVRLLLMDIKKRFRISDERVLSHSMVAYGAPNIWHSRRHRGRKKCGMQFAGHVLRRQLGLSKKPNFDPDVKKGRLVEGDKYLALALYGTQEQTKAAIEYYESPNANIISPERSAWFIAPDMYDDESTVYEYPSGRRLRGNQVEDWSNIPSGTLVTLNQSVDRLPIPEESFEGFKVMGVHGKTAFEIAGNLYNEPTTIYFLMNGWIRTGKEIARQDKELRELNINFHTLGKGTKILVGYIYGGKVLKRRSAWSIAKQKWNDPSTFYILPMDAKSAKRIISGDEIESGSTGIPSGTIVIYKE